MIISATINRESFLLRISSFVSFEQLYKMKLLVFLAVLGLSAAAPRNDRALIDDIIDIVNVLPIDEIRAIVASHIANDPEVREVLDYLQGPEWAAIVIEVREKEAVQELSVWLLERGVDLPAIIQAIHDLIQGAGRNARAKRSVRDMLDEIIAIIPVDELLAVLSEKLENSADVQEFFEVISSEEARELVGEVAAIPEVQRIAQRLREMGVNVDGIIAVIESILGWD